MRLIQPLKFRTLKTGCFKMPRLQTPRLQTAVFQTLITVASGPYDLKTEQPYLRLVWRKIDIRYHHTKEIYWSEAAFALARKWIIFLQAKEGIYIQQKLAIFGKLY